MADEDFGHCFYPHPFFKGEARPAWFSFSSRGRIQVAFENEGSVSGPAVIVDRKDFYETASNIR